MATAIALEAMYKLRGLRVIGEGLASCAAMALMTYIGFTLHSGSLTIGCIYLLFVVILASFKGFWHASLASLLAVALLDYYFVPPIFSFQIGDARSWVALGAFEFAAVIVSRLSAKELRSSREATFHRIGMEKLYELSRNSLLLDLRQPPGPQLVVLIQRIFDLQAVNLFDLNLGRQDRAGEWGVDEEDLARKCYLAETAKDDPYTATWKRTLLGASGPVGALVVRGGLSPIVVDALASLAAISIDRHESFEKEERAENASKSEQLRAAVMDALAHEFKTPLTAVQTASSGLLELGGLSGSQRELVTLINGEAVRMNKLCTRLLLTAKLEAGQVGLQKDEVNVNDLVGEVLAGPNARVTRERVRFVTEDPALTVIVDRALLAMIMDQYLDNARKYSTPETAIEVAVRKSRTEALISVHNFGPSIRIEDRERVFDRFYRSTDTKNSVAGTGIGLSVVRKAAEAHHGHVWVISDEMEGTTFFLSLPIGARRKL
jgi:two-component system sensor histidine kinase KdpD